MSLPARMLLAEDNGMNMEIAEFLSENAGISGIKGYNGKKAPELFEQSFIKMEDQTARQSKTKEKTGIRPHERKFNYGTYFKNLDQTGDPYYGIVLSGDFI